MRKKAWEWIKATLTYKVALLASGFLGLNAFDGWLTTRAYDISRSAGIQSAIEQNPLLRPIADNWMISFKGFAALAVIGIVAWIRKYPEGRILLWLGVGTLCVTAVILWNLHELNWLQP